VIDKLKEAFREEAGELVVELETALLELDQRRDDPETLGRAFRALHTIKGSGAMFGFEGIAGFAHHLESAFDRVRQGELAATEGLINLSLAAADQIKGMLRAGGAGAGDDERRSAILAELRRLTGGADAPGREAAAADAPAVEAHPADAGPVRAWRIHFRPAPGVLVNGTNPLLLLRELGELGPLETAVDASAIPPLEEMDPERCYTAWDLVLRTGAPREAIRDIFIFVEDHC